MKRQLFFYLIATLLIITAPQQMQGAVNTQHLEQYSEKSPLVVLTDWEFPPYNTVTTTVTLRDIISM